MLMFFRWETGVTLQTSEKWGIIKTGVAAKIKKIFTNVNEFDENTKLII